MVRLSCRSVGSGGEGSKLGEFSSPRGVQVYQHQLYVCDCGNNRIQVFDLELTVTTSFGIERSGQGQFREPFELTFDSQGNIYVTECGNGP